MPWRRRDGRYHAMPSVTPSVFRHPRTSENGFSVTLTVEWVTFRGALTTSSQLAFNQTARASCRLCSGQVARKHPHLPTVLGAPTTGSSQFLDRLTESQLFKSWFDEIAACPPNSTPSHFAGQPEVTSGGVSGVLGHHSSPTQAASK